MHKARSSQLLPLPTDTEETHEALSAVQVRKNNFWLLKTRKKVCNVFLQNQLNFLAPLMWFTLTVHSNQHRRFFTNYLQFMDSLRATCIFLTGQ